MSSGSYNTPGRGAGATGWLEGAENCPAIWPEGEKKVESPHANESDVAAELVVGAVWPNDEVGTGSGSAGNDGHDTLDGSNTLGRDATLPDGSDASPSAPIHCKSSEPVPGFCKT